MGARDADVDTSAAWRGGEPHRCATEASRHGLTLAGISMPSGRPRRRLRDQPVGFFHGTRLDEPASRPRPAVPWRTASPAPPARRASSSSAACASSSTPSAKVCLPSAVGGIRRSCARFRGTPTGAQPHHEARRSSACRTGSGAGRPVTMPVPKSSIDSAEAHPRQLLQHLGAALRIGHRHALVTSSLSCAAGVAERLERLARVVEQFVVPLQLNTRHVDRDLALKPISRQRHQRSAASISVQRPISTIWPLSSATGMKSPGITMPRVGCFQRIRASKPSSARSTASRRAGSGAGTRPLPDRARCSPSPSAATARPVAAPDRTGALAGTGRLGARQRALRGGHQVIRTELPCP